MIHELHFVDGIAMIDENGAGRSKIEEEFERWALLEQKVLSLLMMLAPAQGTIQ